jgi:hypothetical protein
MAGGGFKIPPPPGKRGSSVNKIKGTLRPRLHGGEVLRIFLRHSDFKTAGNRNFDNLHALAHPSRVALNEGGTYARSI